MMNCLKTNVMYSNESVFDTEDAVIVDESELDEVFHSRLIQFYNLADLEAVSEGESQDEFDSVSDSSAESNEVLQEILLEIQVTNRMNGINFALNIFMLAVFFLCFIMRILNKNVTNMI